MYNPDVSNNNQLKDITERLNHNFDIGVIVYLLNKSILPANGFLSAMANPHFFF